jgi:hypothetical protein
MSGSKILGWIVVRSACMAIYTLTGKIIVIVIVAIVDHKIPQDIIKETCEGWLFGREDLNLAKQVCR